MADDGVVIRLLRQGSGRKPRTPVGAQPLDDGTKRSTAGKPGTPQPFDWLTKSQVDCCRGKPLSFQFIAVPENDGATERQSMFGAVPAFGCSGRVTGYPEITPKMEFCPDWRPSVREKLCDC
jgi:hypothetical protein